MYLKKLEVQGFKSFASKLDFHFDTGITSIVGPNGSGKSNIADAIRWVLGEQSAKQLRGGKMEDVIFSGTELRKALGYCQVSLTIDNTDKRMPIDYEEVKVTRKFFRSGDSEFYINDKACRLKDIHEIFMDTGVGKEGYSIIGQGQIEKILSSKPGDRRELFDEAAGISKFKMRKENAIKKLEEEKQNLTRLEDIIDELEGQRTVLEKQSETAKKYLTYKEEIRKYDLNLFLREYDKSNQLVESIKSKELISEEEKAGYEAQLADIKAKTAEFQDVLDVLVKEIIEANDHRSQMTVEKERLENHGLMNQQKIKHLTDNDVNMQKDLAEYQGKLDSETVEYEALRSQLASFTIENEENVKQVQSLENRNETLSHEINFIEIEIEKSNESVFESLNQTTQGKNQLSRLDHFVESQTARLEQIAIENQGLLDEQMSVEEQKKHFEDNIAQLQEAYDKVNYQVTNLTKAYSETEIALEESNKSVHNLEKEKSHMTSKIQTLKDLEESYEGYAYAVKKLMEQKSENPKICGVVTDIIEVDVEYEKAIETAIGGALQNIVTEDEATAKQLIQYLKTNQLGRATFMPLDTIQARPIDELSQIRDKGFVGLGRDLVIYDAKYNTVIEYLLGKIIIVTNIDVATTIAKRLNYRYRIVTLDGDVVNPGGILAGGSFKSKIGNILSRKRQIEDLIDDEREMEKTIIAAYKVAQSKKQLLQDYKNAIDALKNQFQELALSLTKMRQEMSGVGNDHEKIMQRIRNYALERERIQKQIDDALLESDQWRLSIELTTIRTAELENHIGEMNDKLSNLKEEEKQVNHKLIALRVHLQNSNERLESITINYEKIQKEKNNLTERIRRNTRQIEENQKEIKELSLEIQEFHQSIENLGQQIENKDSQITRMNEEKVLLNQKTLAMGGNRDQIEENIKNLDKELMRLQTQRVKLETQLEDQTEYIWKEYELTLHRCQEYFAELGSIKEMEQVRNSLQQSIKALGEVNVNAIEDYKKVEERYQFLSAQRADLMSTEAKLLTIIAQLDDEMRKTFVDKFNAINEAFNRVFSELFGGGKGVLTLTEGEDVLESGINIVASPPGKKLQNMMLLSGGEKSLTAISLLFAIQSLKPSPFCVLDEIEAALDDNNVHLFASYLQNLSQRSQFIIITHKKGTMEYSDALYGITMQERGVSTMVSVKLIDDQLA